MNDLISIIVPIHNCEKTIERCLLSITKQSYANLEILLVENGSSDQSLDICKQWAATDPRIKVLFSPMGVSNARNTGLEKMSGIYYGFVDSDDYIDLTMYEKLHESIVRENADMCFCRINNCFKDGTIQEAKEKNLEVLLKENKVSHWYHEGDESVRRVVWRTLFRREVFGAVRFDTRIFFGEDRDYIQNCYLLSSCCSLVDEYLYYYSCNYLIPNFTAKKYYKERKVFSSRAILTENSEAFLHRYGFDELAEEQRFKALLMCIEDAAIADGDYNAALKELFSNPFWKKTTSNRFYKAYLRYHTGLRERTKAFFVKHQFYGLLRIMKHKK